MIGIRIIGVTLCLLGVYVQDLHRSPSTYATFGDLSGENKKKEGSENW